MLLANTAEAGGGMEGFGVPSNMDFYGGGSVGMTSQDGACGSIANPTGCAQRRICKNWYKPMPAGIIVHRAPAHFLGGSARCCRLGRSTAARRWRLAHEPA